MFEIDFQTLFMLASLLAAAISTAFIVFLIPRRRVGSARALLLLMGAVTVWAFCYGMELGAADLAAKLGWVRAQYFGAGLTGLLFFRFALVLSSRSSWLSGVRGKSLLIVPVLTIIGALTNDAHHLMWSRAWIDDVGSLSVMAYQRGPGFWVFVAFSYAMLIASTLILFRSFLTSGPLGRKNFIILMVGMAAPWTGNILYVTGAEPFRYLDFTPLAFSISGVIFFWGILKHQILELIPIARDAVIERMQDAIFVLNLQDQVIDLNPVAGELIAGLRQDMVGAPLKKLSPLIFHAYENCRQSGTGSRRIETQAHDQTRFWRMRHSLLTGSDHAPCGWLISLQDISEQRRHEIAQRESEEKIRSISANALDGIVMTDPDGRVSFWNRAAEKLFGYREAEILGRDLHTHLAPQDFHARCRRAFSDFRRTGTGQMLGRTVEIQGVRKNGEHFPAELSLSPLQLNGQWHSVGIVRDISERKKTQAYLIQSEKMLSVGRLAAGMAHEINNPLAGILSNVQMLRMRLLSDLPANQKEADACGLDMQAMWRFIDKRGITGMIDAMDRSCQRAASIVQNLLVFTQKSDTVFSDHDLGLLLEQTVALASSDFDLKHHYDFQAIEIVTDIEASMPAVPCDSAQIRQVLLNLLKNGARAINERTDRDSPPQFILRVYVEPPNACIDIVDNGAGIPEHIQKRIFEPFFTTHPTGVETGLGLSIAYFIITEKHGGLLCMSSTPDQGTCFTVKLPLQQKP